jgi:hypothetical protein
MWKILTTSNGPVDLEKFKICSKNSAKNLITLYEKLERHWIPLRSVVPLYSYITKFNNQAFCLFILYIAWKNSHYFLEWLLFVVEIDTEARELRTKYLNIIKSATHKGSKNVSKQVR